MAARSKARKRALDVLYESDVRGVDPLHTLAERVALADPPVNDYTIELVEGVAAHRRSIDEILAEYAEGWTVERMPEVDRAALRLGVFELLWCADVPDAVAIDEAVELAKSLSTDESPRFVNGILARVLRDGLPTPPAEPAEEPERPAVTGADVAAEDTASPGSHPTPDGAQES